MSSFAELIASPERELIVLCEFTPSVHLSTWTAVGGATPNVYSVPLSRFVQTAQFPGGIYRRVVGLRADGTDLTERASLALTNANAQSYFWDETAGVLYAYVTGAVDPDTLDAMQAFTTFYAATRGIVLNRTDGDASTGIYYHPWLSGDLPNLSMYIEDLIFGSKVTEGGKVGFTNTHGFFHNAIPDYVWKNKRLRLYLGGNYGGNTLLRSQYVALHALRVEDIAADEVSCSISLKQLPKLLEANLPITPFLDTAYSNMGQGVKGTKKWVGWGRAIIRPDLSDTTVSQGRWTVADAAYQTLFAVNAVYAVNKTTKARTLLTLATDYTVDLTACTVTIVNATYAFASYDIDVDVTGKPDGAGSYYKTFGQITKDMLQTFVGAATTDLDTAAFTQADVDAPEELAVWVKASRSLASIMSSAEAGLPSLERSVMGRINQTLAGLWTVSIFTPGYDASTVTSLRREDIAEFSPQPTLEKLFARVSVYYAYDYARGEWSTKERTDATVKRLNELTDDPAELRTYLVSGGVADTLAARYMLIGGNAPTEVEFTERGALLAQKVAGDKVAVTYSPAPFPGGSLDARVFELIRIDRTLSPQLKISGRLTDLRGIGAIIGRWSSPTAPAWAAATESERFNQGFWSDSAGLIDPADPNTENQSVWW